MGLKITKKEDKRIWSAFTDKLAFIPNGVTVSKTGISQSVLLEGTPISIDSDGLAHIVKTARVAATVADDATVIKVYKGHNLAVGDNVWAVKGGKCYAIASIATDSDHADWDDITVGTTLAVALAEGDTIIKGGTSTGATKGGFAAAPVALVGAAYDVADLDNMMVAAVTMGQIMKSRTDIALGIGKVVTDELKGINLI